MEYNFRDIEKKWREYWIANKVYQVEINEKPKDTMHTDCRPNNMPSRRDSIRPLRRLITSTGIANNWTRSAFRLIGTGKSAPATRVITTGRNGHSRRCSIASIAIRAEKRNRLRN